MAVLFVEPSSVNLFGNFLSFHVLYSLGKSNLSRTELLCKY